MEIQNEYELTELLTHNFLRLRFLNSCTHLKFLLEIQTLQEFAKNRLLRNHANELGNVDFVHIITGQIYTVWNDANKSSSRCPVQR